MGQLLSFEGAGNYLREPLFKQVSVQNEPRNIVLFGETGVGKSSVINMLSNNTESGVKPATVSSRAVGGTLESCRYPIFADNAQFILWDTAGLNEGEYGSVPAELALANLHSLIRQLDKGISLLAYCIRASRYRDILKVNYDLFTRIICQGEIPVVLIVTGLENEPRMSDWWASNKREFSRRGLSFVDCACVTTIKGRNDVFLGLYEESRRTIRGLIMTNCPQYAWTVASDHWWKRITSDIQKYHEKYFGYPMPIIAIAQEGNTHSSSSLPHPVVDARLHPDSHVDAPPSLPADDLPTTTPMSSPPVESSSPTPTYSFPGGFPPSTTSWHPVSSSFPAVSLLPVTLPRLLTSLKSVADPHLVTSPPSFTSLPKVTRLPQETGQQTTNSDPSFDIISRDEIEPDLRDGNREIHSGDGYNAHKALVEVNNRVNSSESSTSSERSFKSCMNSQQSDSRQLDDEDRHSVVSNYWNHGLKQAVDAAKTSIQPFVACLSQQRKRIPGGFQDSYHL
ncbi:hypothetical protein D9756_007988 [Leucocoprinus leucothites]|uniref:G domain-containing protein n=1 Tax=Leucocoprinus leucothites TaxID=201217 RepID=A0A8H5FYE3_9AGAR|nr:hypothetical protein D9756_007988 [Leucoagaricus leucothites]